MSNVMKTALHKAAVLTFEELGFLMSSDELDEGQKSATADATVQVAFRGPRQGQLQVTLCGGLMEPIALNMLGEDEPPSRDDVHDAVKEVANVICGNMLPSLDGAEAVYQIDAPEMVDAQSTSTDDEFSLLATTQLGLDAGRADLSLFIKKAHP